MAGGWIWVLIVQFLIFAYVLLFPINNDALSRKIYGKMDDFDFDIVNSSILDGDVHLPHFYDVFILFLICFARASSHIRDSKVITNSPEARLSHDELCKAFSKFYRRHIELIEKYHVSL